MGCTTVKTESQIITSIDKPDVGDGKLLVAIGMSVVGFKVDSVASVENVVAAAWSVVTVVSTAAPVVAMAGSHAPLHC